MYKAEQKMLSPNHLKRVTNSPKTECWPRFATRHFDTIVPDDLLLLFKFMLIPRKRRPALCHFSLLLAFSLFAFPSRGCPDANDDWWETDLEDQAIEVNEGVLDFLAQPPVEPVHHHHNQIVLSPASLDDGWITLHQCHQHLDPVPSSQVVYRRGRIRDLKIEAYRGIGEAWVEGHTVQLRDVGPEARLCVTAQSKALTSNSDGTFALSNGPFMRRFLDGYYPMHVTIEVQIPVKCLQLSHVTPAEQQGFAVTQEAGYLRIDAWFEGRLFTKITFRPLLHDSGVRKPCI